MRTLHTRKGGFTLIELMIVVAIIGILAAIAIPNFLQFQLRSKTGEAKTNLAAIRTAEEGFFAEFNIYVNAPPTPGGVPGTTKQNWPVPALGFDQVGWSPEGEVFYNYAVLAGAGPTAASFSIGATGDLDANLTPSNYGYIHPTAGGTAGLASPIGGCPIGGVYNHVSGVADLLNTVGPCDNTSGQSAF
ncbi:MAG: type IV pilin protein [Myxococcota bacterium]